jgi:hypothetical protein
MAYGWIFIFGENNYLPFSKLKGLTIVNSIPENQGGKTTLTIDAIKFLLHGNTTKPILMMKILHLVVRMI